MSRILIDLTDLAEWSGVHGGTQRVVYNLAKQFYDDDSMDTKFFVYIKGEGCIEFDFRTIIDRVESTSSSTGAVDIPSKFARLENFARRHTPRFIRHNSYLTLLSKKTFGKGVNLLKRTKHRLSHHLTLSRQSNPSKIKFAKSDKVIILGKPWDNPSFLPELISEKRDIGFALYCIIYDVIIPLYPYLHHPSLFIPYTEFLYEATTGVDHLFCISKSTMRDTKKFCELQNIEPPRMSVIRLGDILDTNLVDKVPIPELEETDFILCVGTIEVRKNHQLLYQAYKLAKERGTDLPKLVIIGSAGWLTENFRDTLSRDSEMLDSIKIISGVSDGGLAWAYNNCLFTIYPSIYEGWGLPVAESLAYGKYCIAAKSSSIPEIGGSLIDYFSPYDTTGCLDAIVAALEPSRLSEKNRSLREEYRITKWGDTYKQIKTRIKDANPSK